MQFESLANELLLDVFEFFDGVDLLRLFFGLNSRFNQLVYSYFRLHQFNLQSLSKEEFDRICDKHLPLLVGQFTSLRLSDNETPTLTRLLFTRGFTLDRFSHLQSLSLSNLYSFDTLYQIIYQCRYLLELTRLNITNCEDNTEKYENMYDWFDQIWSWAKLRHCHLNGIKTNEILLRTISSCISSLSIENIPCSLNCLSHIIGSTPFLQHLCATVYSYLSNDHLTFISSSIKSLKLVFGGVASSLNNLLETLPNLTHLTIATSQVYLDGHAWKELISYHLPQLTKFQLKMEYEYRENLANENDMEDMIDELLDTFQSSFWLEEHQWYVRCHGNQSNPYKWITLYTLPYAFERFDYSNKSPTKSTCFHQQDYSFYDRVKSLTHTSMAFDCSIVPHAQFPYVTHLNLNLRFDDQFWSHFPSFLHLKSLQVSLYKYSAYNQLQTLLNQASRLYSLKIDFCIDLSTKLFQLTSSSIRRLDLIDLSLNQSISYNNEDCLLLSKSSLGTQCEVLLIRVTHRMNIIHLIEKMTNLRLLICQCDDDEDFTSSKNACLPWLENHLPSTYSITRDRIKSSDIQIWIDRETSKRKLLPNHQKIVSQIFTSFRRLFA